MQSVTRGSPFLISLDTSCRAWLLARARAAIAAHFTHTPPSPPPGPPPGTDQMRGCFVSIHTLPGELRGCVGTFEADQPLWRHVQDMAVAAASRDTRFMPLQAEELESCVLEISALTPREPAAPEQVLVGKHGLWVQRGPFRGVLLPQVAVTYSWDRETFLDQACIKAGMAAEAWRDGSVQIGIFTAEVFTEAERLL